MKRRIVHCCDRRAGELVEDGGTFVFRYAPEYLAQPSWPARGGHTASLMCVTASGGRYSSAWEEWRADSMRLGAKRWSRMRQTVAVPPSSL